MTADVRLVRDLVATIDDREPLVVVIGDCILDRWTVGEAERVSREAPAPVVRVTETIAVPGGAANTAVNARALGARVRMVGLIGDDEAGDVLRQRLEAAGVDTSFLVEIPGARTTTKSRVVGGDRVVVRVDELAATPTAEHGARLARSVARAVRCADAAVVCDYGLGVRPEDVVPMLDRDRPGAVVVDAHDLTRWAALHPDLVTPNAGETAALLGTELGTGADRVGTVVAARADVLVRSGARAAVVTLDRDGTVLLEPGSDQGFRTRATPASEQQASGAGDTFCAAATVALAVQAPLRDAVAVAQAAADVVVREAGTSVCTAAALLDSVTAPAATVVDHDELATAVEAARQAGRRVVFTNGCFDVVHRGHTTYLRQARDLGDLLVVALNDDDSVRRLKGPERPINPAEDRAGVLAALACVDLVTVFATDTPIPLIERLRPEVYVKGGDYSPEMLTETEVVRGYGGEVVMVDYVPEHSTSAVVRRIREAAARPEPDPAP
ncbi:D-glycero-beta-D-manno-heptose 1-phosphate adenylyltransferase [Curtobacterium flaccumfaciens pv. flaccumfaciens]|uniref:D-glycero-beta-D-manno-heptose 1-phosphate adenylyltransferase n=1 Tax=Curtobacterium flaccumfaciens TaxID=2035 RepID=UPI00217DD519|nr:D-glycero-beta-D-manno-heptose 1-phosphate adenylyltransferase [Curtobacterium flaccumfaciens]MCS6570146.1 D-glycero-beta-D-manno-heptose 1-phosphate adenylyltransferase [Curtobacterium flaccumfaciens pv. flaccumfaciens]MCS6585943.1 D-glycero-beta-D-manno-heptose 1-phosphate adenylyltransferase [Curtobacterium flaccumfaciens pv. flaccumfaciens]